MQRTESKVYSGAAATAVAAQPIRSSGSRVGLLIALLIGFLFLTAQPASASDGQLICRGADVFSNVFSSSGRARTNACPVADCPTGTSTCQVQYAWFTKCEWAWCLGFDQRSGWTDQKTAAQVSWCENGKQQYQLQMKVTWTASAPRTVEYWGENEAVVSFGGGISYKKVVRGHAVIGFSGGYRIGVKMETDTGATGSSTPVIVSNSPGWITLSC
jgi:hypothetical protein